MFVAFFKDVQQSVQKDKSKAIQSIVYLFTLLKICNQRMLLRIVVFRGVYLSFIVCHSLVLWTLCINFIAFSLQTNQLNWEKSKSWKLAYFLLLYKWHIHVKLNNDNKYVTNRQILLLWQSLYRYQHVLPYPPYRLHI